MKLDFKFSNLCGTVYSKGDLLFTPDGNSIISPVGNRISVFDIVNNKSYTLACESRTDISHLALSPDAALLVAVDEDGRALLINFHRKIVLHRHNFKSPVHHISFSPDGRFIAVAVEKKIQIWKAPGFTLEFSPFVLHRTLTGQFDTVLHVSWSHDSRFLLSSSKDMTVRVFSTDPIPGFSAITLTGHRETVVAAWFADETINTIYSVAKDGAMYEWKQQDQTAEEEEEKTKKRRYATSSVIIKAYKWKLHQKHFFSQNYAKVISATFHPTSRLLSVGFSSGTFGIWEMPDFCNIQTLSISQKKITSVAMNATGEWIAFGCAAIGQLLVWEWKSESYVLKQQGHMFDMNALAYSQDGQFIATGGQDGKLKIWNSVSGFCFVTFTEHSASVTAVDFAKHGQVVFSASLDGTIRAFDLIRYRNFKTFTSPSPVQFTALAVDPSGEVVCGGSSDSFEIYVWSVQTGQLLDVLSGHEGPISCLTFSPTTGLLVSGSWDKTVRIWDVYNRDKNVEIFDHQAEVLALAYRPDGKQIAATSLDGNLSFWNVEDGKIEFIIEGRKDIVGGRSMSDKVTAANSASGKCFTSITYSADGSCILAGGSSKYICIYDVSVGRCLLKQFQISHNRSLDGILEKLNSKNMTEAGPKDMIDDVDEEPSDVEDRIDKSLPGSKYSTDMSVRQVKKTVRATCVRFSPTARSWAASTTEGLLIYSLDDYIMFDPFDLEVNITQDTTLEALAQGDYLKAIVMAFRLGERGLIRRVFDAVPSDESTISLLVASIPVRYLEKFLKFLATGMESDKTGQVAVRKRIEFVLVWCTSILNSHGSYLKTHRLEYASCIRGIKKLLSEQYEDLSKVCDENTYSLRYILNTNLDK